MKIPWKLFCDWCHIFHAFLYMCAVSFLTTHWQNTTRRFYTEGFIQYNSLCCVVGSPYWFIKSLICKTGNVLWVMYINKKCKYFPKTRVCTMIEYAILRNVLHVTSTWLLISWWSGAVTVSHTTCTDRPSWNSLDVSCVPASVWISFESHHSNASSFHDLSRKISSLYITSSVLIFSIS